MIANNLKISNFLDSQIPNFIIEDFPKFESFFKSYYKSLEIQGGILDISNNILDYLDIDSLVQSNLVNSYTLVSGITDTDTSIKLDSVVGLPETDGIIQIFTTVNNIQHNEIIFYGEIDKTTNTLLNCLRGYSATTDLKNIGTTVTKLDPYYHITGDKVANLSNLVLFLLLKNYQTQYLEGFPYTQLDPNVDQVTLIKNIKHFYEKKGTTVSVEFLFRSLYGEEATLRYPREYLIKSSTSNWSVDDIIKVVAISGDPFQLIGNQLYQSDASGSPEVSAIVDDIIVSNISSYFSGNNSIYEIRLNILNRSNFIVPSSTILRRNLLATDTVITVDSTIGFPEENGLVQIDDELIFYKRKTFSQFLDCTRGYLSTIATSHNALSVVETTEYLYGYSDPSNLNTKIKLKLVGVISSTEIVDPGEYYKEGQSAIVSANGIVRTESQFNNWQLNESGLTGSSPNLQIHSVVSKVTSNVTGLYSHGNYAYVASNSIPNFPIGNFAGNLNGIVGGQNLLRQIPLIPQQSIQFQPVSTGAVGMFLNGVEAFSIKDNVFIRENYGKVDSVTINDPGYGFNDSIAPIVTISGGGGAGAQFTANTLNGQLVSVNVTNPGSGYASRPSLRIGYGFDATASVVPVSGVTGGKISLIQVNSPGNNYILPPDVVITDISGRGSGAYAVATISGGTVTGISVVNGGKDYTDPSKIRVQLLSPGRGVDVTVNLQSWNYDRTFTLQHNTISANSTISGWSSYAGNKLDAGNGYLFNGLDSSYGLEYGYAFNPKQLRSIYNDNVLDQSSNYSELPSGSTFRHSPIIGWSYDGHPIYGPYGYSNPLNPTSAIKRMASSYVKTQQVDPFRPDVTKFPLGAFIEDYNYVPSSGDLDDHNGRFCITPEYPNGTYAYFLTVDASGNGVFPYIVGKSFNSVPASFNFVSTSRQNNESLPIGARRIRTQNTPTQGSDVNIQISEVSRGSISSLQVDQSVPTYKVGDYVYLESKDTEGSGALGIVDNINGVTVSSLTYVVSSGVSLSGVTLYNNLPLYPASITNLNVPITFDAILTTSQPHNLVTGDSVLLTTTQSTPAPVITYKVRVSNYQTINYAPPTATTTLTTDLSYNTTTIAVVSVNGFSINDYILIDGEVCQIISINPSAQTFVVSRAAIPRLHNTGNTVSLYIPAGNPDYRLSIGSFVTDGSAAGYVSSIDTVNKKIEIRVVNGVFNVNSVIYDNSTPTNSPTFNGQKQIKINSINSSVSYWEIDPSNTGNYFVRNLNFELIRGIRYIFDVSDPSNSNYVLSFSKDINNLVDVYSVTALGTPGTVGAQVILNEITLNDPGMSVLYYYELNKKLSNNNTAFNIKSSYFSGLKTVTKIDNYTIKYSLFSQPVAIPQSISYTTNSKSSIGQINTIRTLDAGKDYKKIPAVIGVKHLESDDAKFLATIDGGKITNVNVVLGGSRYTSNTILYVTSPTGSGAVLIPNIVNGSIKNVTIVNKGDSYQQSDTQIVALDTSSNIYATSNSIGNIKSIKIVNYGNQLNLDRTLAKSLNFTQNLIVTNYSGPQYLIGDQLNIGPNGQKAVLKVESIYNIGKVTCLLRVQIISGIISIGDTINGVTSSATCVVSNISSSQIFGTASGYIERSGFYSSDLGKISSYSQKITDSNYYQDYSYVIRSTKSLKDYRSIIKKSTHPVGFKAFGEVAIENTGKADANHNKTSSSSTEISINLTGISVQSTLEQKSEIISIMNSIPLSKVPAKGSAVNAFDNIEVNANFLDDISSNFDSLTSSFALKSSSVTTPNTRSTECIVTLDEIFQEPVDSIGINSVVYSGSTATVTTTRNHYYAQTISGVTYPRNQYVTITGVTASGLNLSDKFYIYQVSSPNTFTVTLNNPNNISGTATLNNAQVIKGDYSTSNSVISFVEPVRAGSYFSGSYCSFIDGTKSARYSYKLQNLLFDGVTTTFSVNRSDGTPITLDNDEYLFVFIDGVMQYYGESYNIVNGQIVFTTAPLPDQKFFAFSSCKYQYFDDFSSSINGINNIFYLQFAGKNFKVTNPAQVIVLVNGVPQVYGSSYIIKDNLLVFNEVPVPTTKIKVLYLYGTGFGKSITIYNSDVFSKTMIDNNMFSPDGCQLYSKTTESFDYIRAGDKLALEGESPKDVLSLNNQFIKKLNNFQYTATIVNDNSYVYGQGAVATAVLSGITVSGVTTSGIGQVIINSPGLGYDTAPVVVFTSDCSNPGSGAQAKANVKNGQVVSIDIISPGSGYTSVPNIVFAKRFSIIRNQYPVYNYENNYIKTNITGLYANHLNVIKDYEIIPMINHVDVFMSITTTKTSTIKINTGVDDDADNKNTTANTNPLTPKLGTRLINFERNKFNYRDTSTNVGVGLTIGDITSIAPNLTIGDFSTRTNSRKGAYYGLALDLPPDSYLTFGSTLASGITISQTSIPLTSITNIPNSGNIFIGSEAVTYSGITGKTLNNCVRGANASIHLAGDYVRVIR